MSDEKAYGFNEVRALFLQQKKMLQVEYIDLYMLHSNINDEQLLMVCIYMCTAS